MKIVRLSILFFLLSLQSFAQSLSVINTKFIGGAISCYSEGDYAIATKDRGILFVGLTNCDSSGDIPHHTSGVAIGQSDVLIGKLDSNMNISWIRVYGGSGADKAISACQTPDGGYAVLAYTESNDGNVTGYKGGGDLWLLRIDSTGNLLWEKCYGGPSQDIPASIATTPDSGLILLGIDNGMGGDVPFQFSSSPFVFDWLVIKTDSLGNKQWAKTLGGTGDEQPEGSILSENNGYYLVSSTYSTDHDCTDTSWHAGVNTQCDYYILRLDTAGNVLWDSSYGGSNVDFVNKAIWDDRDSSIVIVGISRSGDYMVDTNYGGADDFWVIKTNMNGTLVWAKVLGYSINEDDNSITLGPGKDYIISGDVEPGPIGQQDGWLFVLDSIGNTVTNKVFGGTQYEYSHSILPYKNGYAAIGGSNSMSFTEGTNNIKQTASEDVFVSYLEYGSEKVNTLKNENCNTLIVYPNPAHNRVRIVFPNANNSMLSMMDMKGQFVYTQKINGQSAYTDIDTRGWAKGTYIVQYKDAGEILLKAKFVIN